MGVYRSRNSDDGEQQRYDRQTIGVLLAVGALLFAVPVILLLGVLL